MAAQPVPVAVRRLVEVAIQAHQIDPRLHRVLAEQVPRTGRLQDIETFNREAHALFRADLERHREQVPVADLDLAAFLCASTIEAVAHNAVLHRGAPLSESQTATLVGEATRLVLRYLQPGHASTRRPRRRARQ